MLPDNEKQIATDSSESAYDSSNPKERSKKDNFISRITSNLEDYSGDHVKRDLKARHVTMIAIGGYVY